MKEHQMTFDQWFDIFCATLRKLGHEGMIDRESAQMTFDEDENGEKYPEDAARELWKEWQE